MTERRISATVSPEAYENMAAAAKAAKLTQWEYLDLLLCNTKIDDPILRQKAVAVREAKITARQNAKELRRKLSTMKPEEIESALKNFISNTVHQSEQSDNAT